MCAKLDTVTVTLLKFTENSSAVCSLLLANWVQVNAGGCPPPTRWGTRFSSFWMRNVHPDGKHAVTPSPCDPHWGRADAHGPSPTERMGSRCEPRARPTVSPLTPMSWSVPAARTRPTATPHRPGGWESSETGAPQSGVWEDPRPGSWVVSSHLSWQGRGGEGPLCEGPDAPLRPPQSRCQLLPEASLPDTSTVGVTV